MDACRCQNLSHAPKNMTILHSPFAIWKTLNFSFFFFFFFFCFKIYEQEKNVKLLITILLGKKKYLQIDLTNNMIDVKKKEKRLMSLRAVYEMGAKSSNLFIELELITKQD